MWAELKNIHILPFYGIVTDLGQHIHMVINFQTYEHFLILKLVHSGISMARKWKCSRVSAIKRRSPFRSFHVVIKICKTAW